MIKFLYPAPICIKAIIKMIPIDGSYGEGGGAITRVALALSAMTGKPFKVTDIRKARQNPGLKSQHLHGARALKELCNAEVKGDYLGSTELEFIPGKLEAKNLNINIGTAGSITLILQSILLPSLFSDKQLKIKIIGGTDTKWSPSFDYFNNIFLPQIQKFAKIEARLLNRGYYPKGNGKVEIRIEPRYHLNNFDSFDEFLKDLRNNIKPINLVEQGSLLKVEGISHASMDLQKANVAERQAKASRKILSGPCGLSGPGCEVSIKSSYCNTLSTGSGITLLAEFSNTILGSDSLGERGKRAEIVGQEAGNALSGEIKSNAAADSHMCDQILPYLALSGGSIKTSKITSHAKTNIYVIEKFLGKKFMVDELKKIIYREL